MWVLVARADGPRQPQRQPAAGLRIMMRRPIVLAETMTIMPRRHGHSKSVALAARRIGFELLVTVIGMVPVLQLPP